MKKYLILISLFSFCVGCNDIGGIAARKQQAEQERRQQTIKDLKKLGNEMHNKHSSEQAADSSATDTPETKPDSAQDNIESSE